MTDTAWNSFARANASERWRKHSASMGTPLTELIVRESDAQPGMRLLDVASGTGEPAISLATLLNGTGEVVATDVSAEPLKIAEDRARQRGLTNIRFQSADVHKLPFEDQHFDRVTSRLGLMFFADLNRALSEIRRVLKPAGRFTAVAWGTIDQPYFQTTIGTILEMFPSLELPKSGANMCKFASPTTLTRACIEAGFSDASAEVRNVDWTWPGTPEEVWEYFQAVTVPFAPLFQSVPEDRRADVTRVVLEKMHRLSSNGEVRFGAKFVLATAVR
ncbi:MAG TPA: class I SAM-dependent methyltransferase [Terriglobales bacterium]|nr:class I SAM-dependent methyltransferase [Terriglobales bacterium]